jgi:hypothetical protein
VGEAVDVQSMTGAHGGEIRLPPNSRQSKNLGKNQEILASDACKESARICFAVVRIRRSASDQQES